MPEEHLRAIPEGHSDSVFGAVEAGEEAAADFFNAWNEEVVRSVPADRLLVFEAKDGWGPLCRFLGVPVPDAPYPRVNDTAEQRGKVAKVKAISYFVLVAGPVLAAALLRLVYNLLF